MTIFGWSLVNPDYLRSHLTPVQLSPFFPLIQIKSAGGETPNTDKTTDTREPCRFPPLVCWVSGQIKLPEEAL